MPNAKSVYIIRSGPSESVTRRKVTFQSESAFQSYVNTLNVTLETVRKGCVDVSFPDLENDHAYIARQKNSVGDSFKVFCTISELWNEARGARELRDMQVPNGSILLSFEMGEPGNMTVFDAIVLNENGTFAYVMESSPMYVGSSKKQLTVDELRLKNETFADNAHNYLPLQNLEDWQWALFGPWPAETVDAIMGNATCVEFV